MGAYSRLYKESSTAACQPATLLALRLHPFRPRRTDLRMASGNASKNAPKEATGHASSLMDIAAKAAEDLRSQAGRLASDLTLARNFGQTLLSHGIIDDRSYLVRTSIEP